MADPLKSTIEALEHAQHYLVMARSLGVGDTPEVWEWFRTSQGLGAQAPHVRRIIDTALGKDR